MPETERTDAPPAPRRKRAKTSKKKQSAADGATSAGAETPAEAADPPEGDDAKPRGRAKAQSKSKSKSRSKGRSRRGRSRDSGNADPPPPTTDIELVEAKKLSQRKAKSIERRANAIAQDEADADRHTSFRARTMTVKDRLALLRTGPSKHTRALRSTELSLRRPHHALTGRSVSIDTGPQGEWFARSDADHGLVRFGLLNPDAEDGGETDFQNPTKNAHVDLCLPSEPGKRYLVEFEIEGAGEGRFVIIDTLARTERKFSDPEKHGHVALIHENPGDEAARAHLILIGGFERWSFRRCLVTTLE